MESDTSQNEKSLSTLDTFTDNFERDNLFYVELDYFKFVAGEKACGEVLINLTRAIEGCFLRFVCVGTEELIITDRSGKIITQERREMLKIKTTLKTWSENTPAGQFVFPFSFKIPHFAPATFYYEGEDSSLRHIKARVYYQIEAMLESISSAEIKCSNKKELQVCTRLIRSKTEYFADLNEGISCLCITKGTTNLSLKITNNEHPCIGGTSKFTFGIDNTGCCAGISQYDVKLVMQISPGDSIANEHNFYSTTDVWKSTQTVNIPPGGIFSQDGVIELNFDEMQNPGSNSSALIKCCYQLVCISLYPGLCGSSNVTISLPILINPRHKVNNEVPRLPEDWKPQEFSIHDLVAASSLMGYDSEFFDYSTEREPMIVAMPSN